MLNAKIQDAINEQINAELYSSYLYLSMSAYFQSQSFDGMAQWMRFQTQEELVHVMKFFDFVNDRGGRVILSGVEAPQAEWASPLAAFQNAYDHECLVSRRINDLVGLANSENDYMTATFLQWFVTEQVEEEATAQTVVDKLTLVGDNAVALFMIDAELGRRAAPSAAAGE